MSYVITPGKEVVGLDASHRKVFPALTDLPKLEKQRHSGMVTSCQHHARIICKRQERFTSQPVRKRLCLEIDMICVLRV